MQSFILKPSCFILTAMKTCTKCKITRPFQEFFKNKSTANGLSKECKSCSNARTNIRRQKRKDFLVDENGGMCKNCGYNKDPRVLQFHHIDETKEFGISKRLTYKLETLRKEIKKCVLLCPNCHAEKHLGLW